MTRKIRFEPNYLAYYMMYVWSEYRDAVDPETGKKACVKFFNQGGTRSGKTYDAIHTIWKICDANKEAKLYISVYRETLVKARDTTLKDFLECFELMRLVEGKDYEKTGTNSSGRPIITLYGNTIEFKGIPETGKEAGRSDIAYVNEATELRNKDGFLGIMQRCELLFIADWNPSLTEHFAFEFDRQFNCYYTNTSYLDNKNLKESLVSLYESWCPFDFSDSHIEVVDNLGIGGGFVRRIWDKPEKPDTVLVDLEGKYRKDNAINKERGTIDRWRWLVYGEGEKARQEGAIFPNVTWIKEFPNLEYEDVYFGLDFGYTNDPSVLTRVGVLNKTLYAEKMCYQKTPDVEILFDLIEPLILKDVERRLLQSEGFEYPDIIIACDSADKYKDVNFVRDLNILSGQKGYNWQFVKVKKPHIVTRISLTKRFDLMFVEDTHFKIEQQNYVYMRGTDGKVTNIPKPIDDFNHIFDSMMYCVWHFFRWYFS